MTPVGWRTFHPMPSSARHTEERTSASPKVLLRYDSMRGKGEAMARLVNVGSLVFGVTDDVSRDMTLHDGAVSAEPPGDEQSQAARRPARG